jgi:PAS domain S-box-containing protein
MDKKPNLSNLEKIEVLTDAVQNFTDIVSKFQNTFQELQDKINFLSTQLEKKNEELKQQISKRENTKNFLNSILENIYTGVIVIDNSAQIIIFNKAAENITGYYKNDVVGLNYREFLKKNHLDIAKSALQTLSTGKETHHRQKVFISSDDEVKEVEYSTSIISGSNNEFLGVAEIFNDVSELNKLQKRMTHMETLAALGEMAASVAHEIRNPLSGIGGFAGLLQRQLDDDDSRKKLVSPIIDGVNRLNSIVTNLLTYTRPQKLKPTKRNIHKLLDEVIDFFKMSVSINSDEFEIITNYCENEIVIYIDSQLFQQILLNMLKNAFDARDTSKEKSFIEIRTNIIMPENMSDVLEPEEIEELKQLFSFIQIDIIDNGKGITQENIQKLFNPFFTTKETGNGLGLAICKKIINLHQGDIHVTSEINKGTTFSITLPLFEKYEKKDTYS